LHTEPPQCEICARRQAPSVPHDLKVTHFRCVGILPTRLFGPLGFVPQKDVDETFHVIADRQQMNVCMFPWKTKWQVWQQLAKYKQVYKWVAERVLNRTDSNGPDHACPLWHLFRTCNTSSRQRLQRLCSRSSRRALYLKLPKEVNSSSGTTVTTCRRWQRSWSSSQRKGCLLL